MQDRLKVGRLAQDRDNPGAHERCSLGLDRVATMKALYMVNLTLSIRKFISSIAFFNFTCKYSTIEPQARDKS